VTAMKTSYLKAAPSGGLRNFSSSPRPERLWSPPCLLSNG